MTRPTDEELDALVQRLNQLDRRMSFQSQNIAGARTCRLSADAITALRTQLAEAVRSERNSIMPEHVIRVAALLIDSLHCLDTEAIQIAAATNKSGGIDGVQVLDDAEKIIKAAAGLVATDLQGLTAIRARGDST